MKTLNLLAAFCLLASSVSAFAQPAHLDPTIGGRLQAKIDIFGRNINGVPTIAAGQSFIVEFTVTNNRMTAVELQANLVALRYLSHGMPVTIDLTTPAKSVTLAPGRTARVQLTLMLPRDADPGSIFHVGALGGEKGRAMQTLFANGRVLQQPTPIGTVVR